MRTALRPKFKDLSLRRAHAALVAEPAGGTLSEELAPATAVLVDLLLAGQGFGVRGEELE